jgi:uncharacterized protein YcaQ
MKPITISQQTARRFVLGKQGLWPGRRWKGKRGTVEALRACEAVQLDPLNVVARSQDIVLNSRVLDYKPGYLQQALYKERQFFDYGGWLAVYPISELPYWRVNMERYSLAKRVEDFVFTHHEIFDFVRAELKKRGPLGNRDFEGKSLDNWNYRGRKETSLALYDMWISGELMMHHRDGFNRVYDFRENIAPKELDYVASEKEAEDFFAHKAVSFMGLKSGTKMGVELHGYLRRDYSPAQIKNLLGRLREAGTFTQVQMDGGRETYLVLTEDLAVLESLEKGKVPKGWKPKDSTTLDEVTLLSPLDIVSARGRAKKLFDFDYKWELYGDDLVARLDPKLERGTMTLQINGFWCEDDAPVKDADFASALAKGLRRFAGFVEAKRLNISTIHPPVLRKKVKAVLKEISDIIVK